MIYFRRRVITPILILIFMTSTAFAAQKKVSVKSIDPEGAIAGTRVVINGENFAAEINDNRVFLGKTRLKVLAVFPSYIQVVIPKNAKSGYITVETRKGGKARSPKPFTVMVPLRIKGVSHSFGPPGSQIKIKGTGFSPKLSDNSVTIGVMRCKVTNVSPNELTVVIPQKAKSGPFTIQVKGSGKVKTKNKFSVARTPKITGFSPSSGAPGQDVTISGANFGTNPKVVEVRLAAVPCQVLSVQDKSIVVRVPKNARTGAFQLAIHKMKSAPSSKVFDLQLPLKATNMAPSQTPRGGEIKIFGTGFSPNLKDNKLLIGAVTTKAIRLEAGAIVFKIPKNAAGGTNGVQLNVKGRGKIDIPIPLIVTEPCKVTKISPTKGSANTALTIHGTGFGTSPQNIRVVIGGKYARVHSVTPNTINAYVPEGATSSKVTVQTKTNGTAHSKKTFTMQSRVTIANFSPTGGGPNQQVRLYGQGFHSKPAKNQVTLNGQSLKVLQASATSLLVQIPSTASSGTFKVSVANGGTGESQGRFAYVAPKKIVPQKFAISQIKPTSGKAGAYVNITGSGFSKTGMRAYVGRAPAGIRVYSSTQAVIAVPNNAATGPVTLTLPNGKQAKSRSNFQVQSQVSINKFYPMTGRPGTRVTIYGTSFVPKKTQVYIGKRQLRVEPGGTSQMMVVSIPPGCESGIFSVRVPGKSPVKSVGAFRVVQAATVVKAPTKKKGSGTIFSEDTKNKSAIEALMEDGPKKTTTAKKSNSKEPPPSIDALLGFESKDGEQIKISSIEPKEGPPGETVMINGSGFGDNPAKVSAWVGAKKAKILGVVPDMIMIEVPTGIKGGKIKLKIEGKPTLTSKTEFLVIK